MKKLLLMILSLIAFSYLVEYIQLNQTCKKLREVIDNGYIYVDNKEVVHVNSYCPKRVGSIIQTEILYSIGRRYCACIPSDSLKKIKEVIEFASMFTDIKGNKCTFIGEDDEEIFVSISNVLKYGILSYSESYPDFKIRMQDNRKIDYLIPLTEVYRALNEGLKIYSFHLE